MTNNYCTLIVYYLLLIYALLLSNNVLHWGIYAPKMHITVLNDSNLHYISRTNINNVITKKIINKMNQF